MQQRFLLAIQEHWRGKNISFLSQPEEQNSDKVCPKSPLEFSVAQNDFLTPEENLGETVTQGNPERD